MTTRKMLMKEVDTISMNGYLLKDIIKNLTELLAQHGDTVQVSEEQIPYEDGKYLALMKPTPETDEEMKARLQREDHYRQMAEVREREEYKRLVAKFGTGK